MKRLISLLSLSVFVLALNGSVFAQDVVQASAEVIQDVQYTNQTDLDFGVFTSSFTGTATIDPDNSTNDANVSGTRDADYFAGKIFISGAASQDVTVTHGLTSVTLNDQSNTTTDFFTLSPITMSQATGQSANNEGGAALNDGGTVTLDGSGDATVWIGGDLTATDDDGGGMLADIYENTTAITFTIDYTF